jgi:integrase/recombinase XerD
MGAFRMNPSKQARFDRLYAKAIEAMKLHGLRKKTIDSYCLTLRRVANLYPFRGRDGSPGTPALLNP